jgi:hypothetical protein
MTKILSLLSILVLLPACGSEQASQGPVDSGVRGLVFLGPSCPVMQKNVPCPDRLFPAKVKIRDLASGDLVATTASGQDGRFVVRLPPGRYVLEPVSPEEGFPFGKPVPVTVRAHAFTLARVSVDTGIR